jgi:hypothetical protein
MAVAALAVWQRGSWQCGNPPVIGKIGGDGENGDGNENCQF